MRGFGLKKLTCPWKGGTSLSIIVSLMGTPRVEQDGKQVLFPYRKAEGLFYYLCVRRSVTRDEAIGIFWADCEEATARKNLRDAIYRLKKIFGDDMIRVEGNNYIHLAVDKVDSIDYLELTEDNLYEKYSGDFLGYFYVKNCREFEDWMMDQRDELLRRYHLSVEKRVNQAIADRSIRELCDCAAVLFRRRATEEDVYRKILSGLIQNNAFAEAERVYEKLCQLLMRELDEEPEEETSLVMQEAKSIRALLDTQEDKRKSNRYFYGRQEEIRAILSEVQNFEKGLPSAAVLITGEAGVGKTAVLQQLRNRLAEENYVVLAYQCVKTEEDLYLKPWNDILEELREFSERENIQAASLPNPYAIPEESKLFATRYEKYVMHMLTELADAISPRKFAVMIDDVQWMDSESRKLLTNLLYRLRNEKFMMILAGRDGTKSMAEWKPSLIAGGLMREFRIRHFTLEETKEIIRDKDPKLLLQTGAVEMIYQNTAGNALFLLELLTDLSHGGNTSQLSSKLTSMIQARLMDLTQEERDILNYISLFPRFATIEDLKVLSSMQELQLLRSLEKMLSSELIHLSSTHNHQGYGLNHQIIRDYIYDTMLEDLRRVLHQRIALYYEKKYQQTENVELCPMLIYHFDKCGDVLKTYTYRLEYLRAFYAVEHEIYPTVLTGQTEREMQYPPIDGDDELVNLAEQIRTLNRNSTELDPLRMKVEFLIGRYDLFSGNFSKGLNNIRQSITLAKKLNDRKYLLENYLQMVYHAIQIHNLKMFNEYITSCENLLTDYEYPDADICTVHRLRGVYYMKNFQYQKAIQIFEELIRHTEPLFRRDSSYCIGLAACYNYIGESRQATGNLNEALDYYMKAIECCETSGKIVSGMGVFYSNAGYAFYKRKEYAEAQKYIDKARRCFEERGALWGKSKIHSYIALLAIERRDREEAETHYQMAKRIAQQGRNPSALSLVSEVEDKLRTFTDGRTASAGGA